MSNLVVSFVLGKKANMISLYKKLWPDMTYWHCD